MAFPGSFVKQIIKNSILFANIAHLANLYHDSTE